MNTDNVNDTTTEFDRMLEAIKKHARIGSVSHERTLDAAVYVRDTLELALAAARTLEPTATLDHALAVFDRIEVERRRIETHPDLG